MLEAYKKLFFLIKDHTTILIWLIALTITSALIEILVVGAVPLYVQALSAPTELPHYNYVIKYIPNLQTFTLMDFAVKGGILLVIIYFIRTFIRIYTDYQSRQFVRKMHVELSTNLFNRYIHAPYEFHTKRNSAEIIRNIQVELVEFIDTFLMVSLTAFTNVIVLLFIISALLIVNVQVTLAVSIGMLLIIVPYNVFFNKKLKRMGQEYQEAKLTEILVINEGLGGIKETKINNAINFFQIKFTQSVKQLAKSKLYLHFIGTIVLPYMEFCSFMVYLGMCIFLIWSKGGQSEEALSLIILFTMALFRLKQSFTSIVGAYNTIKGKYFTVNPIYKDITDATLDPIVDDGDESCFTVFKKDIEVKNVSFKYPMGTKNVLNNINFSIKKGESIGLKGSSGTGKSTLIHILLGLLEIKDGGIFVDGQNINKDYKGWQNLISYIPQETFLLDQTIRNNIAFGKKEIEVDEQRIQNALKVAQLEDFIDGLPLGLDTVVGERGSKISGGQKQRIGIARAIYRNPSILIMDEPTSALDENTEQNFIDVLSDLKDQHTIIIVSHRTPILRICDKTFLLTNNDLIKFTHNMKPYVGMNQAKIK